MTVKVINLHKQHLQNQKKIKPENHVHAEKQKQITPQMHL